MAGHQNKTEDASDGAPDGHGHGHGHGGGHGWRDRLLHIVHSKRVEAIMALLLIIDILVVFIELYLSAEYPDCSIVQRDAFCCNGKKLECNLQQQRPAGCDPHKHHDLHWMHEALGGTTIAILSLFMLELFILIITLGPMKFFSNILHVLELLVVSISMILELLPTSFATSLGGLIVIGRLWRFVRISHGIFETTHELTSAEFSDLEHYTHALEELMKDKGIQVPALRKASEVERLRKKLEVGKKD